MNDKRKSFDPAEYPRLAIDDADWAWFVDRCADLDLPQPDAWRATATAMYSHLVGVNQWMNLTRVSDVRGWLKQHLLDSLTFLRCAPVRQADHDAAPCVDLGSGGGYPGLPLMMALPQSRWVLIDARRKKVDFLKASIPLTGNAWSAARHLRGGDAPSAAPDLVGKCQLVTARAVGQADWLIQESAALLRPGGYLVLAKGPAYTGDEEARAQSMAKAMSFAYEVGCTLALEAHDPQRFILLFKKL